MLVAGMKMNAMVQVWVMVVAWRGHRCECPTKIPKNFLTRQFLCDFGAMEAVEGLKLTSYGVAKYSNLKDAAQMP